MQFRTILLLTILCSACDRPECTNHNPVFDQYPPDSLEYEQELAIQLKRNSNNDLTYWIALNSYYKAGGSHYMKVNVQGGSLCAIACFDITGATGLDNYLNVKGKSYGGAQLKYIKYHIDSSNGSYHYYLDSIGQIID